VKIDTRCYKVTENRRGLPSDAPTKQTQAEDEFNNFALFLHLGVQTEKFSVDRLNTIAALVFLGPSLPGWTIAVKGPNDLRVIIEEYFD
jgi:hypothetical protein